MKQYSLESGEIVVIRRATKADANAILIFIDVISHESDFLTFGQGEFEITLEQEENFIDTISRQDNSLFLIAEIDGIVIGNLTFMAGGRPRIAHVGEVAISILKNYWNNGLGTYLMDFFIHWCRQSRTIKKINLRVRTDNFPAIHLYKKLGFVDEGLLARDFLVNGIFYDSILMGFLID